MVKLSRLMQKESVKSVGDSTGNKLEITDNTTRIVEKDANKKDSIYWSAIRPIPLSDVEMMSLKKSDSLNKAATLRELKNDTTQQAGRGKNKFLQSLGNIAFGHTWSDTSGFSLTFGGLLDNKNLSFNTVDGFVYGLNFRVAKSWDNRNSISLTNDFLRAFSREKFMWRSSLTYRFNRMKQSQMFLRTGITSRDIGTGGGINTFLNSVSTLFLRDNYLRLYESRYSTLGYRTELANGLILELNSTFDDRRVLQNTTNYSIIRSSKVYSANVPVNAYLATGTNPQNALTDQRHFDFLTKITYTPFQRYRINNGVKSPWESDWPTFIISWQHGFNERVLSGERYSQYDMIRFEANKSISFGAFSEFRWRVRTGGFLDNRSLSYYDFFHFNSQAIPVLLNDYEDAFMLPAYYSLSTPEFFGEIHVKYTTPYLLVKLLPILSNTLMRENLSLSCLGSRFHSNYAEIGYSISEVLLLGELGIYAGFNDFSYSSVGFKLVLKLDL